MIAERDWSDSLGPIEDWPQSLKTATSILLASPVAMVALWGPAGIMLYNDAYSVFAGGRHPELLGSPVREGWPEVADFNDHVMSVGLGGGTLQFRDQELTLHRHGYPEQVWMDLDYSPLPGDDGRPGGVLAVVTDTTGRMLAERRFALRYELDERLRASTTPEEIAEQSSRLVSEQLNGVHVGFSELEGDGEYVRTVAAWANGRPAPHVGERHRADDFGSHFADVRQGRDVVVSNVADDPRTAAAVPHFQSFGVASFMILPLIKEEQFSGYFFAVSDQPRYWTEQERGLLREVAERAWASMRRSRAEIALRNSEQLASETSRRLDAILNNTSMAVFLMNGSQRCVFANAAAERLTGYSFEELSAQPLHDVIHNKYPDGRPYPLHECPIDRALPERANIHGEEMFVHKDGSFYPVAFTASPLLDSEAKPVGTVIEVRSIAEDRAREQALRETEERYRMAAKATNDAIWDWDLVTNQIVWNEAVGALFGHSEAIHGTSGHWWEQQIHADDRQRVHDSIFKVINGDESSWSTEYRFICANGGIAHVFDRGAVMRDANGRAVRMIGAMLDITERKKAEQHQRLLIDELSHRAKNLLAIIQSVAQQSFKGEREPADMVRAFEGRLGALAAAHGVLTKENWEAAPIRQIICDTITAVKDDDDHRLKLEGPDMTLPPKTGVSLAMAVHELATNAIKYGSFSVPDGRVLIRWQVEDGRLRLQWREVGGPLVTPPTRRGFGSRMIERGLAAELGGKVRIDFLPEGIVCFVDAPLPVSS